ncbi:hypothetical protein K488DRAFT_53526 [Vararia minispora EC-137]|uniref:Uncharacterized protein n=1 Tax=Vararia minispora EC-137 TaxID=1314806 RepID=A0ACB8QGH4_9AGAM|nr:hypothetical protein K488DRAFT_53526 [Vararia minispora EC-137]
MSIPRLLPRYLSLRALAPRINPPLLPLTSRLGPKELTRAPRISTARLFHPSPSSRLSPSRLSFSNSTSHDPLPPNATLSQRLKHLVRAYGWYALGVYAVVSILDFGVAFAGINILGAEYVSSVATAAKAWVFSLINRTPDAAPAADQTTAAAATAGGQEGLYAMLLLAYTVHKTIFLPVRIGVTATCTPRIVGWLRARGWAGSSGTRAAIQDMRERIRRRD